MARLELFRDLPHDERKRHLAEFIVWYGARKWRDAKACDRANEWQEWFLNDETENAWTIWKAARGFL